MRNVQKELEYYFISKSIHRNSDHFSNQIYLSNQVNTKHHLKLLNLFDYPKLETQNRKLI